MDDHSQLASGPHTPAGEYRAPAGDGVSTTVLDAYTDVPTTSVRAPVLFVDGVWSVWFSAIRNASFLEWLLIVVLFTLIAVLIGIRGGELLLDRDGAVDPSSFRSRDSHRQDVASQDEGDTDEPRSDDRNPYEDVISIDTPPRLLSDEGRVVQLLVENDGEIRQHRITDETGWSKSKVSRICSRMCEDGTIEKTTVGRENVISLAEGPSNRRSARPDADNPVP
ncbi:helix-turn-helix transcriptional regulator [Natrarchaeobius chitinivorans]|uniref:helix-turn-helix transcriptional regulator n=1 Tax=Natrarchaeobius chitinivorans TaxID=1679083 RepID=UPI001A9D75CF|nr:MarR family transcriptional regulator [Natrarchaeobius chitinivorans]